MFSDREMLLDTLCSIKHDITDLTKAAMETSDDNLRQSFIQLRNQAEQTQLQLSSIGTNNGWYVPAPPANNNEVDQIKQHYENILAENPILTHV